MPTTRTDRILAAGTLVSTILLVALVAANWHAFRPEPPVARQATSERGGNVMATPTADVAFARRTAPRAAPQPDATRARPTAAVASSAATPPPALELHATGGPTWLEVRAGGADGEQLYYGMLAAGKSATFQRLPVWVRVGAAQRLELALTGTRMTPPSAGPNGVVEFIASAQGIEASQQPGQ